MKDDRRRQITRRSLLATGLAAGAALPLCSITTRNASGAAEFDLKWATGQDPTHPINTRQQEALNRIREATGGRVDIKLFPANQLGSDTDLLSQVRSGGVDFFNLSSSILSTLVSAAGILNTGFAFPDYDTVWKAMDGEVGTYVRGQITKVGIQAPFKIYDNGFRQITSSTRPINVPADLKGFKIRVPPSPILTSLFKALDAGPAPINFNEVYSALQTKVVEGQENPLPIIYTTRLYEVQKYCSMTGHTWDGYWILANRRSWESIPEDLRTIIIREVDRSAVEQREDIAKLSISLRNDLTAKGLVFNDVDRPVFRQALGNTTYYKDWKSKFGDEAWSTLEKYTGPLA
ncbi:MAG: TRAP transporter substrate-binding protein [Rhodospirillales bacterium]